MSSSDPLRNDAASTSLDWPMIAALWVSLMLYGAIAAPVPAVNEPHYLTKARHFWQPDWCASDFFLTSPNAHTVFYMTVGLFTHWFSFEESAWIGRAIAMSVLVLGWMSLTRHLLENRWSPLLACWMFLACTACGNFSGEWLVGGVEGKVLSYGLLFLSFGQFLDGRVVLAGGLAGLAVAFHPVVGVWGMLAFAGACLLRRRVRGTVQTENATNMRDIASRSVIDTRRTVLSLGACAVLALPGLIPVMRLLAESTSPQTRFAGTYIQVYYRLAHHLDPMLFPRRAYLGYAGLLVVWGVLSRGQRQSAAQSDFARIVLWSVGFAAAGILIGWGPRPASKMAFYVERMNLLKFYPFRLADVLVPVATSLAIVKWIERWSDRAPQVIADTPLGRDSTGPSQRQSWRWSDASWIAVSLVLYGGALWRTRSVVEVNRYSGELRSDWLDACRWINRHLPEDAMIQAPHNGWAFKWFAERAEYVAFKDCPQDATGIVEWNRRLLFLKKWYEDQYSDQFYSADELRDLRRQTGITHLLTDRLGPLALEPIYRNETFQVYDLTSLD